MKWGTAGHITPNTVLIPKLKKAGFSIFNVVTDALAAYNSIGK